MQLEIISEDEDKTILKARMLNNKKKTIHLISKPGLNSIGIFSINNIPFGMYDPEIKKIAIEKEAWEAILEHEIMHIFPEFTAQWYSTLDILPEEFDIDTKRIIPNIFEDIAINHTLFRWESSPVRAGSFKIKNVIQKIIQFAQEVKYRSNLPPTIAVVRELMNNIHTELISNLIRQRENTNEKKEIHLNFQGRIYGDVVPNLLRHLKYFINSNAVSLNIDERTVICNIKLKGKNIGNPVVETRCNGVVVPQFVYLSPNIINNIYDNLDVHFAEAYNIKVDKLRNMAYNNYKKIFRTYKNKEKIDNKSRLINFTPNIYSEDNRIIFDFNLETSESRKNNPIKNKEIKFNLGTLNIKTERAETPWERYNSIKNSELFRLKKWIK